MDIDPEESFTEIGFTVGRCAPCDRDVLTYPSVGDDDSQVHCVHCDEVVSEGVRLAAGGELPDHGYGLLELQGCGNPDCGGGACSRTANEQAD